MVDNIIIMAGGIGQRLWPASVESRPKQFLPIAAGKTLIRAAMERALDLRPSGSVILVINRRYLDLVRRECALLPPETHEKIVILAEPVGRNTAPALALAGSWLMSSGRGSETSLVLAADHLVSEEKAFTQDVANANQLAQEGLLVVFGIKPTHPETGYGYIKGGQACGPGFHVDAFKEKPDRAQAENFLKSGHYLWNSGMFCYRNDCFWDELTRYSPTIHRAFAEINWSLASWQQQEKIRWFEDSSLPLERIYAEIPTLSFDHGVLEKSNRVALIVASFSWTDVGSWDVVAQLPGSARGVSLEVDGKENFVFSDIPVALCEVEDLLVIIQNGSALICQKGASQKVKEVCEKLKKKGRDGGFCL